MFGALRPREPRTKVHVPCRVDIGGGWADACIHNMSSRGLLVESDAPPEVGGYVDIRRGPLIIIGRVAWRDDHFFGVRTQDPVSLEALVAARKPPANTGDPTAERRSAARFATTGDLARRAELNRYRALALQFTGLAITVGATAAFLASQVYATLARPFHAVAAML